MKDVTENNMNRFYSPNVGGDFSSAVYLVLDPNRISPRKVVSILCGHGGTVVLQDVFACLLDEITCGLGGQTS